MLHQLRAVRTGLLRAALRRRTDDITYVSFRQKLVARRLPKELLSPP
jgi:hypothetical protein